MPIHAVILLQSRIRQKVAMNRAKREVEYRRMRLRSFSRPIFCVTLLYITVMLVVEHVSAAYSWDVVHGEHASFYNLVWLGMLAPCLFVLFVLDSYAAHTPQFSITHVIFFVQVLYHSLYRMSAFTSWMFFRLEALLDGAEPLQVALRHDRHREARAARARAAAHAVHLGGAASAAPGFTGSG